MWEDWLKKSWIKKKKNKKIQQILQDLNFEFQFPPIKNIEFQFPPIKNGVLGWNIRKWFQQTIWFICKEFTERGENYYKGVKLTSYFILKNCLQLGFISFFVLFFFSFSIFFSKIRRILNTAAQPPLPEFKLQKNSLRQKSNRDSVR